ncbi:MAG: ATP-dependent helicase, partial [Actinobacteria bacterium]|nr:ATP-dependent helicase [Actinomycetota bacterium]
MATATETRVDPDGWDTAIAATDGPQLVVAGPGAGKTEFLVRRALHLIDGGVHPEQILMLSFSRRGAADLRRRVAEGLDRSLTTIPASTFHSLAFRLLEAYGVGGAGPGKVPALLTGPEQTGLVAELLADEAPGDWPVLYRGLLPTAGFADEVADFVLRCREQLIDPIQLAERASGRPQWRALPAFLERYLAELRSRGRIDYGSLQAEAVDLLDAPSIREAVAEQHPYVLVDEYQDTTVAQAQLLERLTRSRRNLTVAGDPYQSIYSFRGTAITNIAEFPEAFRGLDGTPGRRLVLTTSFRVPAEILEAAVRVTAGGDLPGAAGPVVPAKGRGSVEVYRFDQLTHEAEWIASEIQRVHLRDGIPYRNMAVLVRSTRHMLPELSRALERRGVPHDPPDTRLADHPAVRLVLDCVRAATGTDRGGAVKRLLLGPLVGLPLSAMRDIQRDQIRTGDPWSEVVRRSVPGGEALAGIIDDPTWADSAPAAEGFWHLWSTLPQLAAAATDPARVRERAAWSSLAQVLGRLGERDPAATLSDYLRWSESEDFEATPLLEYRSGRDDRLTLTTLHQAKGLGWDLVFIADAREGVFPDLRARESLLGSRHLSGSQPEDPAASARARLQEEMRLAYTAMCRAATRVVWTCTTSGWEDGRGVPSRFLSLVSGRDAGSLTSPAAPGDPATPLEAEAWLRRMVRDPAETAPRRLAALGALTGPGEWRRREAAAFAGMARRGPDTGLVPAGVSLSPSQAESYLTCPRLYAFRRWLHVDGGGSVYLDFGSLIHGVLEETERAALERGDRHGTLDEALAALDGGFDPAAFGGNPWAAAWHAKATRVLTHLYEAWPGGGRVAAVEYPVEMEVAGTRWRGRIDRVEVEEQETSGPLLRVVDYKTGTSMPTVAEAGRSVQLGFYMIAAREDPHLAGLGCPGAAELWFPAARSVSVTTRALDTGRLDEVEALM